MSARFREIIVASRVESALTKAEILELYLNSAYLGRGSWGVEMAARSYFGKSAKALTLGEGAMLAGLLKGPNFFNPDRRPERAKERLAYVLGRMQEDGVISPEQKAEALAAPPKIAALDRQRRNSGFHFVDFLGREAKADGIESLTAQPYTVHSTINATLQRDTEAALQEGLAHYEIEAGRVQFHGPEANISDAVKKLSAGNRGGGAPSATADAAPEVMPAWQQALAKVHLPLYDVHWEPAVILKSGKRDDDAFRVGLADGRILPLVISGGRIRRSLNQYDVVYVRVIEGKTRATAQARLRVRPTVQRAALVLENKTGRILAMAGSFSYPLSQLNRTTQTQRQPGSAIKPLTYLTALQKGLQPNTLVLGDPITLPPVGARASGAYGVTTAPKPTSAREEDYWKPRNAGNDAGGIHTMRRGLENSVNTVTAHLLDGGIEAEPERSLDDICATAVAAKIYTECVRYYPFVLGAQPVRMINLAAFYAAVADEGARPQPHAIELN